LGINNKQQKRWRQSFSGKQSRSQTHWSAFWQWSPKVRRNCFRTFERASSATLLPL